MITGAGDWVGQWARTAPWRVALRDAVTGDQRSYAQLDARAWRLAHALTGRGVRVGDRVALLARNTLEIFEVVIACLRVGAAFTPLNWRLAEAELAGIIADCQPHVLIHDAIEADRGRALYDGPTLAFGADYEATLARASVAPDGRAHDPETLGMLLYTSGTTGRPKGVMIPHRQLFWNALNTVYACDLGPDDRVLGFLPLFHTGGLNCLATPALYRGATVVLMDSFDPGLALQVIEAQRITTTVAVPTMYHAMLDAGLDQRDTASLRTLLCGGAPCPEPLLDAWLDRGFCFRQGFGMTEVGPNCFSLPPWMIGRMRGSVGQAVLHGDAAIIGPDGAHLGPDTVGELCLAGPHVCAGYWNDDAAFDRAYRDGWFRTGDLASHDAQGYFHIAGRRKDMFISGGENVYPAEVENVILGHPGVDQVAVIGVPHPRWGEVGLAAVVPKPGAALDADVIQGFCRARLAKFKVPKRVELLSALPLTASGKVSKPTLRRQLT